MLNLLDGFFKMDLGEGAFYAVFGFVFVFVGIAVLILIFTGLGALMNKLTALFAKKKDEKRTSEATKAPKAARGAPRNAEPAREGAVPEEIAAVIAAAIAAYYDGANETCGFVVRRIRRI